MSNGLRPEFMSEADFGALTPRQRGFAVYVWGNDRTQPHVPAESNPYPSGSKDAVAWDRGQRIARLAEEDR